MRCMSLWHASFCKHCFRSKSAGNLDVSFNLSTSMRAAIICLMIVFTSQPVQPAANTLTDSVTQDVRVHNLRVEYTFTIRYPDEQGGVQETTAHCTREYHFDTPISLNEAILYINMCHEPTLPTRQGLVHAAPETPATCGWWCEPIWCCRLLKGARIWEWKPDGVLLESLF